MHLFSFYPQTSDVGETHSSVPATVTDFSEYDQASRIVHFNRHSCGLEFILDGDEYAFNKVYISSVANSRVLFCFTVYVSTAVGRCT
jgi:hypothetical protein